jgi:hypothetical protein
MADIVELERRIAAALDRIGRGLDGLAEARVRAVPEAPMLVDALPEGAEAAEGAADPATDAALTDLRASLAAAAEREALLRAEYQQRVDRLGHQLDVQGLELQRMRKTAVTLREELRRLREAAASGLADPGQVNRAMLAELDAMRAVRLSELAELDELSAALDDHLTEAEHA